MLADLAVQYVTDDTIAKGNRRQIINKKLCNSVIIYIFLAVHTWGRKSVHFPLHKHTRTLYSTNTVKKKMKCSWDFELLQEIVHAFPIFVLYHELCCVASRNPRFPLHFLFTLHLIYIFLCYFLTYFQDLVASSCPLTSGWDCRW